MVGEAARRTRVPSRLVSNSFNICFVLYRSRLRIHSHSFAQSRALMCLAAEFTAAIWVG